MVTRKIALAAALAFTGAAAAEGLGIVKPDLRQMDPRIIEQARQVSTAAKSAASQASTTEDMAWIKNMAAKATQLPANTAAEAGEGARQEKGQHPLGSGNRTLIYVSWSMGADAIKDILTELDGQPGVGIVFRGIPDGMSMPDAMLKMQGLTQQTQSSVSVLLDPTAFQRHGIEVVPSIAIETPDEKLLLKAEGLSSPRYLEDAAAEGKRGDLGVHGPTQEIAERDLIELAKERMAKLDMEAMKKRALERFWTQHPGYPLPPVSEPSQRTVDPSVIIPEDIRAPNGTLIQKAGSINPLDIMPFDQKLVVIDPTQPWQVALAKREYADNEGLTVSVMATQIPPSSGWDLFNSVQDEFGGPLFLLPPDMAERFQIQRAPSIVTADKKNFIVREISREEFEGHRDVKK